MIGYVGTGYKSVPNYVLGFSPALAEADKYPRGWTLLESFPPNPLKQQQFQRWSAIMETSSHYPSEKSCSK